MDQTSRVGTSGAREVVSGADVGGLVVLVVDETIAREVVTGPLDVDNVVRVDGSTHWRNSLLERS